MPLRNKYPITEWILSKECVKPDDIVAFWCTDTNREVHAIVLGFPSEEHRQYISIKRIGGQYTEVLNYYETIVYHIGRLEKRVCTCGAKHTGNPKFHLSYCDFAA